MGLMVLDVTLHHLTEQVCPGQVRGHNSTGGRAGRQPFPQPYAKAAEPQASPCRVVAPGPGQPLPRGTNSGWAAPGPTPKSTGFSQAGTQQGPPKPQPGSMRSEVGQEFDVFLKQTGTLGSHCSSGDFPVTGVSAA